MRVQAMVGEFNAQELANTVWAFAKLEMKEEALMKALSNRVRETLVSTRPRGAPPVTIRGIGDLNPTEPHAHGILCRSFGGQLTGKRSRLPAALDADFAMGRPRNDIALDISQSDHRIVEARQYVGNAQSLYLLRLLSFLFGAFSWQAWPSSLVAVSDPVRLLLGGRLLTTGDSATGALSRTGVRPRSLTVRR